MTPVLLPPGLVLRAPRARDYAEWREVRLKSRVFLKPYEPRWTEADLSRSVYAARLRRGRQASIEGTEYTFFIFAVAGKVEHLAGGLTLSNIRRRVAQHVSLGYWMSVDYSGQGMMTRAVGAVLPFIFEDLHLHRAHAACLPDNFASRRVLEKNGFTEEGYADKYLQIDGVWRDHVLYGLTRERFDTSQKSQ